MRPQVITYTTPVRAAAPQAVAQAVGLGWLFGKAIRGDNGATRIGYPGIGMRNKYQGYVFPPQIFRGFTAGKVAGGAIKLTPAGLPSTQAPDTLLASPLTRAMATVGAAQIRGA